MLLRRVFRSLTTGSLDHCIMIAHSSLSATQASSNTHSISICVPVRVRALAWEDPAFPLAPRPVSARGSADAHALGLVETEGLLLWAHTTLAPHIDLTGKNQAAHTHRAHTFMPSPRKNSQEHALRGMRSGF